MPLLASLTRGESRGRATETAEGKTVGNQRRIRAVLMRGGTSRGVFFLQPDLPEDPDLRDRVILKVFGGGDPYGRQVDGLGGAVSTTSKVVLVGPPSVPEADVNFTFGQVSVTEPLIDYGGTCGNLTAAVGPFAIEEGLVRGTDPVTTVRIWQTNTRKRIHAHVPTRHGLPQVEGEYAIDGVPGTGARIALDFLDPAGSVTGRLLPTGRASEELEVPGVGTVTVSLVDAVNPVVFVRAGDVGLRGTEGPEEVDGDPGLLARLERVRAHAAVRMGIAQTPEDAARRSPGIPKLAFVAAPASYRTTRGGVVEAERVNVVARILSMGKLHRAYALSGAACTAVAARMQGTVVHELARPPEAEGRIWIGHPAGVLEVAASVRRQDGVWQVDKVTTYRTARRLMEGYALIPWSVWPA